MLKKYLYSFFLFLVIFSSSIKVSAKEAQIEEAFPNEGWVVYATPNYFSLLEITIASVHSFSQRSIVAVGVNSDIPFSTEKYPRLIKKRIDVDLQNLSIYLYKPKAILASGLQRGIYIDADAILNQGCDELFKYCEKAGNYPLCPRHEDEAPVSQESMNFFGVTSRSMHYVHADVIVFSARCKDFLSEWCETCLNYPWLGNPCYDETLLNIFLWKIGATEQLFTCDPYNAYFERYLSLDPSEIRNTPYNHWYMFHGNKYPERGWDMLRRLQNKHLQ